MMTSRGTGSDLTRVSIDQEHVVACEAKRRKIRKGTRSCWECKRRKIRCLFSLPLDTVCTGCRKRGTECVSQEYPEKAGPTGHSTAQGQHMGDRIVRVEALIEQLVKQKQMSDENYWPGRDISELAETNTVNSTPDSSNGTGSIHSLTTFGPMGSGLILGSRRLQKPRLPSVVRTPEAAATLCTTTPSKVVRYGTISAALHAALPPRHDIHLMIRAGIDISFHNILIHPYATLAQTPGAGKANLADIPQVNAHPTLLAKYLLILATCLLFVHPEIHAEAIGRLSQPPQQLRQRLVDTANNLVINNDEFLGTIDGLQCIMLEASYQANSGNLRRAWFTSRRAMVVAQMMGIHRSPVQQLHKAIDDSDSVSRSFIWYRIVSTDRQLSLMLGLPQGTLDVSMASETALSSETLMGRFERHQCVIASRILERNELSDPSTSNDLAVLQEIDAELQKAASEMPGQWWLIPNLAGGVNEQDPEKIFWDVLRLLEQMFYFNLLNLLHLPYMLRSSISGTEHVGDRHRNDSYNYSKLASVSASRELLTRFIMFRSFKRVAFCCRAVDFFALTASLTLIIAYLDTHRKQRQQSDSIAGTNIFIHQRYSDRAMMEQVLENMEDVARLSTDALSERISSLLKDLMALEADAAAGKCGSIEQDSLPVTASVTDRESDMATHDGQPLRLGIPYFGTIKITREGIVSMEVPAPTVALGPTQADDSSLAAHAFENTHTVSLSSSHLDPVIKPLVQPLSDDVAPELPSVPQQFKHSISGAVPALELQIDQPFESQFPSPINDVLRQQYLYPGLAARIDDWAFQGVDMAFFDSLIRGSAVENSGTDDNWTHLGGQLM